MKTVTTIQVPQTEHDDPAFVELVSRILNGAVRYYEPQNIYLVQIDNWFGDRWRGFPAGISIVIRRRGRRFESLTVPPFHPHRVNYQLYFRRIDADGRLYNPQEAERLHYVYGDLSLTEAQLSLRERIHSGVCVWYSGRTKCVDRGSLMLYRTEQEGELSWYVGFLKHDTWKIELAKGIGPEKVSQFMSGRTGDDP